MGPLQRSISFLQVYSVHKGPSVTIFRTRLLAMQISLSASPENALPVQCCIL